MSDVRLIRGTTVLLLAHVCGLIDLVALPLWVGVLVQHYRLDFEKAGLTVTVFLLGVVSASAWFAPRFDRLKRRVWAIVGYTLAAVGLLLIPYSSSWTVLIALHAVAGAGTGCGLSMAHGAMGRAPNPHRLLALGGLVLGIFSVIFYMVVPSLIATAGRTSLFEVMGGMMACVAVASIAYPEVRGHDQAAVRSASPPTSLMALWPLILGGACLALNQSIMFSFLERVGAGRGFGRDAVNGLFAAIGIVNLFPSAVAGLLQKRLPPIAVAVAAMIAQAGLAFTIAVSTTFAPYAIASAVYTSVIIFTHPFLFGLTAHLDPSGRTNALTPAMMMIGSALGPAVAGTVAQHLGFDGLGLAVGAFAAIGLSSFLMLRKTVARCNDSAYMSGPAAQTVE